MILLNKIKILQYNDLFECSYAMSAKMKDSRWINKDKRKQKIKKKKRKVRQRERDVHEKDLEKIIIFQNTPSALNSMNERKRNKFRYGSVKEVSVSDVNSILFSLLNRNRK